MISNSFRKDRTIQDVPLLTQQELDRQIKKYFEAGGTVQVIAMGEGEGYEHPSLRNNRAYAERGQKASGGKAKNTTRREVGY